jgi:predicted ATPase
VIRTPDQRLRVFVSSTLQELAEERAAVAQAVRHLRLAPVMFELGARAHPPRDLYRAYVDQSDVFIGIYWQRYGWVAPGEEVSGLEDEYRLATAKPKLIYVKAPAPDREGRLKELLVQIRDDDHAAYKSFSTPAELRKLVENDLAVLLSERFLEARVEPSRVSAPVPAPATSFVGRERELSDVAALLKRADVRLVTLTGPGGVGKSRLSLEAAKQFSGEVAFVPLASISDPRLLRPTIAHQLGAHERPLAELLGGRRMLLVLDNFEQVVDAASDLAQLLSECPQLHVLVSSRTALHVRGEFEVNVPPLEASPAVQLFLDRARAIKPDFATDPVELAAVAEICHRVDGLPLAIELASARVKMLSARDILARLDHALLFLKGGARDLPVRQQTLRATLDWSYQLLDETERCLFACLGVFSGGWTLDAAVTVCACGGDETEEMLAALVDRSLVQVADGRFSMLTTIRDYAAEKLAERHDADAMRRAHAEYVLALAEHAAARLRGGDQHVWRARLGAEQDNIRAALRWLLDNAELDKAVRLQTALVLFWWVQGYAAEARRWTDELLEHESAMQPISRARLHLTGGLAMAWEGDYDGAVPLLRSSVDEARKLGDAGLAGVAQLALAYVAPTDGATESLLLESAADLYQVGDLWAVNVTLQGRAEVALAAGDVRRGRELYEDSLELAEAQKDSRGRAQALVGIGFCALLSGDPEQAAAPLRESVPLSLELGNPELLAQALRGLAGVAVAEGEVERAARLLGAAQALADAAGTVDWPVRRGLYAHFEQQVRERLGASRFEAAWSAGQRLSLQGAADVALATRAPVAA